MNLDDCLKYVVIYRPGSDHAFVDRHDDHLYSYFPPRLSLGESCVAHGWKRFRNVFGDIWSLFYTFCSHIAGKWRPVQGRDNKYFTVDICVSKWSGLRRNMVDYEIVTISPFLEY